MLALVSMSTSLCVCTSSKPNMPTDLHSIAQDFLERHGDMAHGTMVDTLPLLRKKEPSTPQAGTTAGGWFHRLVEWIHDG